MSADALLSDDGIAKDVSDWQEACLDVQRDCSITVIVADCSEHRLEVDSPFFSMCPLLTTAWPLPTTVWVIKKYPFRVFFKSRFLAVQRKRNVWNMARSVPR